MIAEVKIKPFILGISGVLLIAGALTFKSKTILLEKTMKAEEIAKTLGLEPHPEGGFFRETYRSQTTIPTVTSNDGRILRNRTVATAIYYLVTSESFSALHRVTSDETFHFYFGDPVEMLLIKPNGDHETITLGSDVLNGQQPQFTVNGGYWQGTRLKDSETHYALLGTTVYPGFDFEDFEMGVREKLKIQFPKISDLIDRYTR